MRPAASENPGNGSFKIDRLDNESSLFIISLFIIPYLYTTLSIIYTRSKGFTKTFFKQEYNSSDKITKHKT